MRNYSLFRQTHKKIAIQTVWLLVQVTAKASPHLLLCHIRPKCSSWGGLL